MCVPAYLHPGDLKAPEQVDLFLRSAGVVDKLVHACASCEPFADNVSHLVEARERSEPRMFVRFSASLCGARAPWLSMKLTVILFRRTAGSACRVA